MWESLVDLYTGEEYDEPTLTAGFVDSDNMPAEQEPDIIGTWGDYNDDGELSLAEFAWATNPLVWMTGVVYDTGAGLAETVVEVADELDNSIAVGVGVGGLYMLGMLGAGVALAYLAITKGPQFMGALKP